jgi:hypothetical protein
MHYTILLTIAFAAFSTALPQTPPATVPSAPNGVAPPKGAASPKAPSQGKSGSGGGVDLRPLAELLKDPSYPKKLPSILQSLAPLWDVPDLPKFAPSYLDWRNSSNIPFVMVMPNGPAPTGCSPYELLIGEISDFDSQCLK